MALTILLIVISTVLTGWLANDARRRGRRWIVWGVLTWFFGLFALAAWLVVRRRSPVMPSGAGGAGPAMAIYVAACCLAVLDTGARAAFSDGFLIARVEGQAMAPTLLDQDRLVVGKRRYRTEPPRRGDLVMFLYPPNPDKSFVKRLIGEEGDTLRSVNGTVSRNDRPIVDWFVPPEYRSEDSWGPLVVPEGHYFVMGDHRNNSSDSRHWGFVPRRYIVGRVQLRWWPVSSARVF